MHATIQKPLDEIMSCIGEGEKVFVVGCDNCAAKCKSGGIPETERMAERLKERGASVVGWCVPQPKGMSLCKLSNTRKVLQEEYGNQIKEADTFLVLSCGQGVHTVIDATDGGCVIPGCDTIFGGETVSEEFITEYCSLCGECLVFHTGGLCPMTLCAKNLLNGPCGGAKDGKCETNRDRDCGWQLIIDRLKATGRLDAFYRQRGVQIKDYSKGTKPRSISLRGHFADFRYLDGVHTVDSMGTGQAQGGAK